MLSRIYTWLRRIAKRALDFNTELNERTEFTDLNNHMLADIGCKQQCAERAAKRKVRMRMLLLPPY
jgi:hypothetical protein